MFEQLFGSKTRVKLLSLFFNNPGRPFYVREITRKVDEQINSVRRELSNLLSIGIVKSENLNNKLYYEVNDAYEFYTPLRSIFVKIPMTSKVIGETKEEDKIGKRLRSAGNIELAFLTGSYTNQSHVSVDLVVVGDVNKAQLSKVVTEMEQDKGHELNYTVMTPDEYGYRVSLNDRFLNGIISSKKIVLIDGSDKELTHTELPLEDDEAGLPPRPSEIDADAIPVNINISNNE